MDYAYLKLLIVKYRPCTVINQKSVENKIIKIALFVPLFAIGFYVCS